MENRQRQAKGLGSSLPELPEHLPDEGSKAV